MFVALISYWQSIMSSPIIWKGLCTGIGCSGCLTCLFPPVTVARWEQDLQNSIALVYIPFQYQLLLSVLYRQLPE